MGEVLAVGDQALVQVAGEQRDAVGAGVVPEEVAGHADLAAAAGTQDRLIEPRPLLNRLLAGGLQTGKGDRHHDDHSRRTPVLARSPEVDESGLSVQRQDAHSFAAFVGHDQGSLLDFGLVGPEH